MERTSMSDERYPAVSPRDIGPSCTRPESVAPAESATEHRGPHDLEITRYRILLQVMGML